jgi:hypothetical protein
MPIFYLPIPYPAFIARFARFCLLLYQKIRFGHELKYIELTKGKYAIISLEDYEKISQHKWRALRSPQTFYAVRSQKGKTIYMHNQVAYPPSGMMVDHIDHNGLNNSRGNLQLATRSQNACNRRKRDTKCTSRYKGVWFNKREGKWMSSIKIECRRIFLGYFDNQLDAAKAYDKAAKEYHGKFAALNFG